MSHVPPLTALISLALVTPVMAQQGPAATNRFIDAAPDRYAQGVVTPAGGEVLYIGGQVGLTEGGVMPDGFEAQLEAVFTNLKLVLDAADFRTADIVELTYYVVAGPDRMDQAYWGRVFEVRERILGPVSATGALVYVPALYRPEALVEVSGVAVRRPR